MSGRVYGKIQVKSSGRVKGCAVLPQSNYPKKYGEIEP
jgi:hypothetical protein